MLIYTYSHLNNQSFHHDEYRLCPTTESCCAFMFIHITITRNSFCNTIKQTGQICASSKLNTQVNVNKKQKSTSREILKHICAKIHFRKIKTPVAISENKIIEYDKQINLVSITLFEFDKYRKIDY